MAVRKYKPTTPSLREMAVIDSSELTRGVKAPSSLFVHQTSTGGRNALGRMTVRHRGGGAKQKYRIVDFKRYFE